MIHSERRNATLVVTIDRTERRNAVDLPALEELREAFSEVDPEVRAVVLTGAGEHFCAGADLGAVENRDFARAVRNTLDAVVDVSVPTIAAIDGFALGAGTQLACACDLRVATERARFGVPAARLGIVVDEWTVRRVERLMGASLARGVLIGAETLDTDRAFAAGFVHRRGDLDDALGWAEELEALAPLSLAGHKVALEAVDGPAGGPAVEAAVERAWTSDDLREGIAAFRERRTPHFRGR